MATYIESRDITIGERLGVGSYGTVHQCTWARGPIYVAAKILNTSNYQAEMINLLRAQHENIVRIYGINTDLVSKPMVIMEFADCGSLDNALYSNEVEFSYLARHTMMLQCAKGVEYLHDLKPKVIHRDLKPGNLVLFKNYRTLKICDFGTARDLATLMTNTVGTAAYIAPEVLKEKKYTEKCDVYSFGIILWEIMSRKQPFKNLNSTQIIANVAFKGIRPDLKDLKCDDNLSTVKSLIEQCWDPEPTRRPSMKMMSLFLGLDYRT